LEWVRRCQTLGKEPPLKAKLALGVDVANSDGGDKGAISRWRGWQCWEVVSFACPNANNLGYKVYLEMQEQGIEDEHVGVDAVGVGAGTVNELHKRERWVKALQGGPVGNITVEEFNASTGLRSQMWWVAREDIRQGWVSVPDDPELVQDLITPQWEVKNGVIVVESKELIKKRLGRSPNKGDAFVYGCFVRDRTPIASEVPKRAPTLTERLRREIEELDDMEHFRDKSSVYGSAPLRQG